MSEGVLVGGEPMAILAASSVLYEVANRTDDVGRRLAGALASAATTIAATTPFAPGRAFAVGRTVGEILGSPAAGLGSVGVSLLAASQFLRQGAQALEAAGAVGLMARGWMALRREGVPEVLDSADGLDLRRESFSARISWPGISAGSNLVIRQVEQKDKSVIYVVEQTQGGSGGRSIGAQVNGVGAFADISGGDEFTRRWAVRTPEDAEKMAALLTLGLASGRLLPQATEVTVAAFGTATLVGGVSAATATIRGEHTVDRAGTERFSAFLGGAAVVGLAGVAGTGSAGSTKVTVERSPAGAVSKLSVTTTTEVDRGRHGNPLIEAANRETTLTERPRDLPVTPEHRVAAERIADDLAHGRRPNAADLDLLNNAYNAAETPDRVYDVRHQSVSGDVAIDPYEGGGSASIDTAVLRRP